MRLATPQWLTLLALLVPLLAIYLLSGRPQHRVVSALWLWRASAAERLATAEPKRPTSLLPWLLAASAIACAALAASAPVAAGGPSPLANFAVILDVSASMNTREGASSRFELAQLVARDAIQHLHPDTAVLIVAAGKLPLTSGFHKEVSTALQELDRIRVLDVEDDLQLALEFAAEQLASRPGARDILLITDGAMGSVKPLQAVGVPVRIHKLGSRGNAVGISKAQIKSRPDASTATGPSDGIAIKVTIQLSIRNFLSTETDVHVSVTQRNVAGSLASASRHFTAGEEATLDLEFSAARSDIGTGLVAEVSPGDLFSTDDKAYLIVPESAPQTVWLTPVGRQPWLTRAFQADPTLVVHEDDEPFTSDTSFGDVALFVSTGACPTRYPATDFLLVAPPIGPCLSFEVGKEAPNPVVTDWDDQDLALRFLNLASLQILAAMPLSTASSERGFALLSSQRGTLIGKTLQHGSRGTILGFDLEASDWPSKASFVVFARNLVELSQSNRMALRRTGFATGQTIELAVPASIRAATVLLPDGSKHQLHAEFGRASLSTTEHAGFYYISWNDPTPGSTLVAVNLESFRESNPSQQALPATLTGVSRPETLVPLADFTWLGALFAAIAALAASAQFVHPAVSLARKS